MNGQQLTLSVQSYADLYDFVPVGCLTLDPQGMIREINLAGARALGADRMDLIGRSFAAFISPADKAQYLGHLRKCRESLREVTTELMLQRPRGRRRLTVRLHTTGAIDATGEAILRVAIVDISENRERNELRLRNRALQMRVDVQSTQAEQQDDELRRITLELSQVEQRERLRMAQILHDHFQQLLVAGRMKIALIERRFEDAALLKSLREIDELLEASIAEARSLAVELSPPILHEAGLVPALQWLARQKEKQFALHVSIDAAPDAEPRDKEIRLLLFLAVKELLFNVVKHARVSSAKVWVNKSGDDFIEVGVSDQGRGIEGDVVNHDSGFGMSHIGHRLQVLGGRMEIHSQPGQGTRVLLRAPCRAPE